MISLCPTCAGCPLKERRPVAPTLAKHSLKLVVIGEWPNKREEHDGRPFGGFTGALFDETLKQAGIERDSCHLTNAAICRADGEKEGEKAAGYCAPRLLEELVRLPPVPILTLGKAPAKTILGITSLFLSRGFVWKVREQSTKAAEAAVRQAEKKQLVSLAARKARLQLLNSRNTLAGRVVFPTVAPSFVVAADAWRPIMELDFRRVGRWLQGKVTLEDALQRCEVGEFISG